MLPSGESWQSLPGKSYSRWKRAYVPPAAVSTFAVGAPRMAGWRQKPPCEVHPGPSQKPPNWPETGVQEYVAGYCTLRSESFVCQCMSMGPTCCEQFSAGVTEPQFGYDE